MIVLPMGAGYRIQREAHFAPFYLGTVPLLALMLSCAPSCVGQKSRLLRRNSKPKIPFPQNHEPRHFSPAFAVSLFPWDPPDSRCIHLPRNVGALACCVGAGGGAAADEGPRHVSRPGVFYILTWTCMQYESRYGAGSMYLKGRPERRDGRRSSYEAHVRTSRRLSQLLLMSATSEFRYLSEHVIS